MEAIGGVPSAASARTVAGPAARPPEHRSSGPLAGPQTTDDRPPTTAPAPVGGGRSSVVLPRKFVVGGAIILLAVAYLAFVSLGSATVYYLTVSELHAKGPSNQVVRVGGKVEPGSIVREGAVVRFTVSDGAGRVPVVYGGVVPDIFAEDTEVVVEGRLADGAVFRASNLLTKCPSRFEASQGSVRLWA